MSPENKKRIIVIDDDSDFAASIRMLLENNGYEMLHAENGIEGIALTRAHKPDLIILDILMQEKDGLTTFGELKADEEMKTIPIIVITSVSERLGFSFTSDDMQTYYKTKPNAYMNKAFDPDTLLSTIKKLVR